MMKQSSSKEPRDIREKRLRIRSMRRGTKEMDIILEGFFAMTLSDFDNGTLEEYEALLDENDQDLYQWISGQTDVPSQHTKMINLIKTYLHHKHG
jgi:antitoxin CptB